MAKTLLFNCAYSDVWVHPTNWRTLTTQKSLKLNWYVECKFYDPLFKEKYPKGFPFRKRLNRLRSLEERKSAIELLLKEIPVLFEKKGYNPITKQYMIKQEKVFDYNVLSSELPIMRAFRLAHEKINASQKHKDQIRFALNRLEVAVNKLRYNEIKIGNLKRSELKSILDFLDLPDNYYNKFRAYLSSLFCELLEYGCCEYNLARDLRKRKTVKNIREVLEIDVLKQILDFLKVEHPVFYNYTVLFFYSGARSSELFRLKKCDVDLEKQEYKVIIQKGKQYTETKKVILNIALPYWQKAIQIGQKDDYLFSTNLVPGQKTVNPNQITRRWKYHVKNKLVIKDGKVVERINLDKNDTDFKEITSDFYALKHLFLDIIDTETSGGKLSSQLASHTSENITNKVYLVGRESRKNEALKNIDINILNL